jgi:hypothetical protein
MLPSTLFLSTSSHACCCTSATASVVPLNLLSRVLLHSGGRRSSLSSLPCPGTLKPPPASFLSTSSLASYYTDAVISVVLFGLLLCIFLHRRGHGVQLFHIFLPQRHGITSVICSSQPCRMDAMLCLALALALFLSASLRSAYTDAAIASTLPRKFTVTLCVICRC